MLVTDSHGDTVTETVKPWPFPPIESFAMMTTRSELSWSKLINPLWNDSNFLQCVGSLMNGFRKSRGILNPEEKMYHRHSGIIILTAIGRLYARNNFAVPPLTITLIESFPADAFEERSLILMLSLLEFPESQYKVCSFARQIKNLLSVKVEVSRGTLRLHISKLDRLVLTVH